MTPTRSCSLCGGELVFEPEIQLIQCRRCRKKFSRKRSFEHDTSDTKTILPFAFSRRCFEDRVLEWLLGDKKIPDDLADAGVFDSAQGIYVPVWFHTGSFHATWSASAGYTRGEEYQVWCNVRKQMETKTRYITDWRPCSGARSGTFSIISCAGWTEKLGERITKRVEATHFESGERKPFDEMYGFGFRILEFSQDSQSAWAASGKKQFHQVVRNACSQRVPGDKCRDLSYDTSLEDCSAMKLLVPFWVATYKYKGKDYFAAMHGFNLGEIIGDRPEDPFFEHPTNSLAYRRIKFKGMIMRRIFFSSILLYAFNFFSMHINDILYGTFAFYSFAFFLRKHPDPVKQPRRARLLMHLGHLGLSFIFADKLPGWSMPLLEHYYRWKGQSLVVDDPDVYRRAFGLKISFVLMIVVSVASSIQSSRYLRRAGERLAEARKERTKRFQKLRTV